MKLNTLLEKSPSGNFYGKRIVNRVIRMAKIAKEEYENGEALSTIVKITDEIGKKYSILPTNGNYEKLSDDESCIYIRKTGRKWEILIRDNGYLTWDKHNTFRNINNY